MAAERRSHRSTEAPLSEPGQSSAETVRGHAEGAAAEPQGVPSSPARERPLATRSGAT